MPSKSRISALQCLHVHQLIFRIPHSQAEIAAQIALSNLQEIKCRTEVSMDPKLVKVTGKIVKCVCMPLATKGAGPQDKCGKVQVRCAYEL